MTQSLEVSDIQSFSIDDQNDQIAGSTSPNRDLSIIANNVIVQTRSDDVGNWLGNFAGKTDLSWDSSIEIKIFDDNGNLTEWRMTDPKTPIIIAGPNQGFVFGRYWPSGLLVHMTVERSGSIVYASDAIVGPCGAGNPAYPGCGPDEVYFDLGYSDTGVPRFDLEPGDMITLAGGEIIRRMIVPGLLVTDVDISTSTITGTADAGMDVLVTACPGTDTRFMVTPDTAGHWTTIAPFDLVLGMGCAVIQTDEYGNITIQGWAVPEPRIEVNIMGQWIQANEWNWPPISIWSLGMELTLTIDDPTNGVGVDYTDTAVMEHNPDNPGDPNDIRANFDWPAIGVQPGFIVKVKGNNITKTLIVSPLQVVAVDVQADTITGLASPSETIQVCTNVQNNCINRYVTADGDGSWLADYHNPGIQSDEQETVDLIAGSNGWVQESDIDGDITHADWQAPNPRLSADLLENNIKGFEWLDGMPITLTVDDPDTTQNPDFTATQIADVSTGVSDEIVVLFDMGSLVLQPGYFVTITDGTTIKTHTILNVGWTSIDFAGDIITGIGEPGMVTWVWAYDSNAGMARRIEPNADRSWTANFAEQGGESWEGILDIHPGMSGGISQVDADGDETMKNWMDISIALNQPPVANAGADQIAFAGETITLNASGSSDPESGTLAYAWDLDNDGQYDDASGVTITTSFLQPGDHVIGLQVTDEGGLIGTDPVTITVLAWTLKGFYQPVDMNGVYNLVKNGSTVPVKFEIFAGSTELTDVSKVKSLTYAQTTCDANAITDEIETTVTGGTSLRYADGQFIYNWKTPKAAGCYRVTLTTLDGSSLIAFFKLK